MTINIIGQAATLLVGFASSIMLARFLGPTDRGLLALLQSAVTICVVVAGVSLPFAVGYYVSRSERQSTVLGDTLLWALAMGLVLIPVVALTQPLLARTFAHGRGGGSWILAAILVPITFLDYASQQQLLGQRRFGLLNVIIVAAKTASLVGVVLLIEVAGFGVSGGLVALGLASVLTVALASRRMLADGSPSIDLPLLRRMLGYGSRVQIGAIFTTLNYRLDVVILQFFRPLSDVGFYVVAQIMAELATILASGFALTIMPLVAGAATESDTKELTIKSLRHHGLLTIGAVVLNAGFSTAVIYWAYGSSYHAAIVPMLVLLPGMWFLGTGTVITNDLRGRDRPGTASMLAGLAVFVTVVLDLTLIPPFGVIGAAIASDCAYAAFGIASLVVLARIVGVPVRVLLPTLRDIGVYRQLFQSLVRRLRPPVRAVDTAA